MCETEYFNGFAVSFWAGSYHATDGKRRISGDRIADVYEQITNLIN